MIARRRRGRLLCALAFAAAAVVASRGASAAPPSSPADEVILRDGTRLVGHVRNQAPGRFVVVETIDGRIRTLAWDAVFEVSLASPPRATSGGVIGYELRAATVLALYPTETFATKGLCATGTGLAPASIYGGAPSGRATAAGGALGLRAAYAYEWMPRSDGRSSFWSVRAGTGLDVGELVLRAPRGASAFAGELCGAVAADTAEVSYESSTLFVATVPLTLGGQVGFGGFRDPGVWRGVVLGLSWAPSYAYAKPSVGTGGGSFRPLGIEATVDFATLDAGAANRGVQPHLRLFATLLPPSGGREPLVALLGLGAAWY